MQRRVIAVESSASLAAGKAIAAIFPPTNRSIALRRLIVGGRAAASPGQVTAAVIYGTSSGTASVTLPGQPIGADQYIGDNSGLGSAHSQFTVEPNYGSDPLYKLSFNSEGGSEKLKWGDNEFLCQFGGGGANSILLYTVNAAPTGYIYTVTFEMDVL